MSFPKIYVNLELRISVIKKLTDEVKQISFVLKSPKEWIFLPGQFVTFKILNSEGKPVNRSYSIASVPNKNKFDICVKILPDGKATPIIDTWKEGQVVNAIGPSGRFVINNLDNNFVFLAAGTGLAPFRSMIGDLLDSGIEKNIALFFSVSYRQSLFYVEEFKMLEDKYPNFKFYYSVTRPTVDDTDIAVGRVHTLLEQSDIKLVDTNFYICGLNKMITDVKFYLNNSDVSDDHIYFEKYD